MRTAEEQWQIAGYQCGAYATLEHEGLVFVDGKGGRACMRQEEWAAYQAKCFQGAPSVSMMVVETEELARSLEDSRVLPDIPEDDLSRIYNSLKWTLVEIRDSVSSARRNLSVEDYGEALDAAFEKASLCVGCVDGLQARRRGDHETGRLGDEELLSRALNTADLLQDAQEEIERLRRRIREQGIEIERLDRDAEARHQEDIENLQHIRENEWLKEELKILEDAETRRRGDAEPRSCPWCQQGLLYSEDRGAHCDACGYGYGEPEDDLLEALNAWHVADFEECATDLLKNVPVEGGRVDRNVLRNMIGHAFLEGAVSQLTRPYQKIEGGSDAA